MREFLNWVWRKPRLRAKIHKHKYLLENINQLHLPQWAKMYHTEFSKILKWRNNIYMQDVVEKAQIFATKIAEYILKLNGEAAEHEKEIERLEEKLKQM